MVTKKISVLNWNVGGAKYFELETQCKKDKFYNNINGSIEKLISDYDKPDVITLQEVVEFGKPTDSKRSLIEVPRGYHYHPCILIDSERHPYVSKWTKAQQNGNWPPGTYFGQGLGLLWRNDSEKSLRHCPIWSVPQLNADIEEGIQVEVVYLRSGLYFGTRDTEPRVALVAHFVACPDPGTSKPLDIFVVNLHLTTLTGEREGVPKVDQSASKIRLDQVNIVLEQVVSTYNEWAKSGFLQRGKKVDPKDDEDFDRHSPVWILSGDFNCTPNSPEYRRIELANFTDACPDKGDGTKGSGFGSKATISCDYIFAGPKYVSLDPLILGSVVESNPRPIYHIKTSDHYPLFAEIPIVRQH